MWNYMILMCNLHNLSRPLRSTMSSSLAIRWHLSWYQLRHLFSRQVTRNSDILYTSSVVAVGLELSLWANKVRINGMIFIWLHHFGSSRYRWEPVWLTFEHAFKFISKRKCGKASAFVAALPDASACKLWQERREQRCWERVTERGSYTTREALH